LIPRFASRGAAQPLDVVNANPASAIKKVAFQQFPGRLQQSRLLSVIAQSKEFDCSSKLTAKQTARDQIGW